MTRHVTVLADRLTTAAARGVTRRRLLRNSGAGALGLALGSAMAGTEFAGTALAHGTSSHPCGPSPIASENCPCYRGNCNVPCACIKRNYSTYTCNASASNCWTEDYRNVGKGRWSCCDVCVVNGSGPRCSGSCGSYGKHAAICRTKTG
jgi:hypothetical protein